jgi:hypothetical protein
MRKGSSKPPVQQVLICQKNHGFKQRIFLVGEITKVQRKGIIVLLVFVAAIVGSVGSLFTNVGAQVTLQSCTLPSDTPTPWMLDYDGSRYIWFSGPKSGQGYIIRVDTQTVLSSPVAATQWWAVAPATQRARNICRRSTKT